MSNMNTVKDLIIKDKYMTDMEKLIEIFNIDKIELKKQFPELYYTILAVIDKEKKPDATNYFNSSYNIGDTGITTRNIISMCGTFVKVSQPTLMRYILYADFLSFSPFFFLFHDPL